MENLFETLGEAMRPVKVINPDNQFDIDYSVYVDCFLVQTFDTSVRVIVLETGEEKTVGKKYILTTSDENKIRANKNFLY